MNGTEECSKVTYRLYGLGDTGYSAPLLLFLMSRILRLSHRLGHTFDTLTPTNGTGSPRKVIHSTLIIVNFRHIYDDFCLINL